MTTDTNKCKKCGEGKITARFLGKDICSKCYDKITKLLKQ